MVLKILKTPVKNVDERERKRTRAFSGSKKSWDRSSGEQPSSLEAFEYLGRGMNDPRIKLKLLGLTPRNPAQETSAGVQEFVKHVTNIIRENNNPFKKGQPLRREEQEEEEWEKEEDKMGKNLEKSKRSRGSSRRNSSPEKKFQKVEAVREISENERRTKEEMEVGREERKDPNSPKRETVRSRSGSKPVDRKRLRRSGIPLLKNRPNPENKTEIVSLLVKEPLQEIDSVTSISPTDQFKGEAMPEHSDVSISSVMPKMTEEKNRARHHSRTKALDFDKVKTSSFTVLQRESDSLGRLESFHLQNLTAKETARAEIALEASKNVLMSSKTSFGSIKSKKGICSSGGDRGGKQKKSRKNKEDQEMKKIKRSETPHLDICKEIIATGKVGCLIPKGMSNERSDKSESKRPNKSPMRIIGEYSKKNKRDKIVRQAAEPPKINPVLVPVILNYNTLAPIAKRHPKPQQDTVEESQETEPQEITREEFRPEPADLGVKGTAFEYAEVAEKPSDVDKIKLEIKINVTSEEDSEGDLMDCDSSGDSRTSVNWFLGNRRVCKNAKPEESKPSGENFSSWDLFADEVREPKWEPNALLQGTHRSLSSIKRRPTFKRTVINVDPMGKKMKPGDEWSCSRDLLKCSKYFQADVKPDAKVRSGLTRSSNQEEKILDDPAGSKLKRRNSEPHSLRGFIWKHSDVTSSKNLKPSVSSVASSLRHLNTDELDDFIFWEAVPQKMTSCWEMSLYHFKRPWSVLSCSVFRDNRRSNTPGLILESLRNGGVARRPYLYQNDRMSRHKGNIFDVEPSISQKNIDIRNWLAALNFTTTPIPATNDVITEGTFPTSPVAETQVSRTRSPFESPAEVENFHSQVKRRNVPQLPLQDKVHEKKIFQKEKRQKSDKWNVSDMGDLKELIRRESGSYVTKEQNILSELSNPRSTFVATDSDVLGEPRSTKPCREEGKPFKGVERSCQSEPLELEEVFPAREVDENPPPFKTFKMEPAIALPEINIWKYLFLFALMFIVLQYSLGSTLVNRY